MAAQVVKSAPTLNYQGRITASGSNFTGQGYFKFVLIGANNQGVWSNDGSAGTNEPAGSVAVEVNNGLFNVELGEGMEPIHPLTLHDSGLKLRTWFSTNNASFELLMPDVQIRPIDIGRLNTGNAIIVDDDGSADFDNLQDAVDFVAFHHEYNTIVLLPGYYYGQVVIPSNAPQISIRSLSDCTGAIVEYTNGPTLLLSDANLFIEGLTIRGTPAIADSSVTNWYNLNLRNCVLQRGPGIAGPTADLSKNGQVLLKDCEISNDQGGSALAIAGSNSLTATHCEIGNKSNAPVVTVTDHASCEMESCDVDCWDDTHASLFLWNLRGWCRFDRCNIRNGLIITNGLSLSVEFVNCSIDYTVGIYDVVNSSCTFCECELGYQSDVKRVEIIGGAPYVLFRNCNMTSYSNTTFYARDAVGSMTIRNSRLQATDGSVLEIVASSALESDETVEIRLLNCEIENSSDLAYDKDAIVLFNDESNPAKDSRPGIRLTNCRVQSNTRDAIHCVGPGCDVAVNNCDDISGARNGITATNGAEEINVINSVVSGNGGDAVRLSGSGMLYARASELWGGEADYGRGAYLSLSAGVVINSLLGSFTGPGLQCDDCNIMCNNSVIVSVTNTMAELSGTNCMARFNHCALSSIAELFGAQNRSAAITLRGATGETPVPRIVSCSLEPSPQAAYAIDLMGGAITGNVMMVNSVLTTNINPKIGKIAPASQDTYGNQVVPFQP